MPNLRKKSSIAKQNSLKIQSNIFENASELRILVQINRNLALITVKLREKIYLELHENAPESRI